jgi:quinol monooxygenase YgiN
MIQRNGNIITSIDIFTVEDSSKQQRLLDMLKDAIKQTISKHQGFISATVHKSLDGTKVINYIQWQNKDAIEKMLNDPKVLIHMNDVDQIAKADRNLYEIDFVDEIG